MNERPQNDASDFTALLHRAKAGDDSAVSQLVERYRRYLLLIANSELDPALQPKLGASDVVQEVAWTAQQHFRDFRGEQEKDWRAWLRAILQNDLRKSRRGYQAGRRDVRHEVPLDFGRSSREHNFVDKQPTPATNAALREKAERLQFALTLLPEDYKKVIELRSFEQLTFEQIGQHMSRTAEAARKLWSRAIQELQRTLQYNAPPELLSDGPESSRSDDNI